MDSFKEIGQKIDRHFEQNSLLSHCNLLSTFFAILFSAWWYGFFKLITESERAAISFADPYSYISFKSGFTIIAPLILGSIFYQFVKWIRGMSSFFPRVPMGIFLKQSRSTIFCLLGFSGVFLFASIFCKQPIIHPAQGVLILFSWMGFTGILLANK